MTAPGPRSDKRTPRKKTAKRGAHGRAKSPTKAPTKGTAKNTAKNTAPKGAEAGTPDAPSGRKHSNRSDAASGMSTAAKRPAAEKPPPGEFAPKDPVWKEAEATPKKAESTPKEAEATPKKAEATPKKAEATPKKAEAAAKEAEVSAPVARFIVKTQLPKVPAPPAARASREYAEHAESSVHEAHARVAPAPVPDAPESPTEAFDQLYELHARPLMRQTFLLCGHRRVAERAVEWAFHQAWERWPEVAADRDPGGWVRATAYGYALSPWHQLLPGRRRAEAYAGPPADRTLLDALLKLPRSYRAALVLFDCIGLSLPDTAAETEASTRATAGRITHARAALAQDWPELRDTAEDERGALLARRLRELAAAQPVRTSPPPLVRRGSEHTTRRWTRASVGLTATVTAATVFTLVTADDPAAPRREQPRPGPGPSAPAAVPPAVPSAVSPGGILPEKAGLPPVGRAGLALPGPGDPAAATRRAYLPQLRSTNARMHLKDFKKSGETHRGRGAEQSGGSSDAQRSQEEQGPHRGQGSHSGQRSHRAQGPREVPAYER
ncbi:RNA polymerase sigma factor [Streptomyces iconiensis]|uniref:DNA-directed RNA polymerase specialized sigma subunit, sigma24 family n=1 Tax=Streptomyces iconiensis TaxID=1384038 RepID=A0ABT7A3Q7_9ACTN|nr:hypothetical protein [Streptomyces iconiensis]MDJ1135979.1 hypothetical protein [Streptomyces iconiensis]